MFFNQLIRNLPIQIKLFLGIAVMSLSIGYFTGLTFVLQSESETPKGIIENYNGNEYLPDSKIMKFKKSHREILIIIHTHVLSISIILLIIGSLVWKTEIKGSMKAFLTIEPFFSLIVTFGGIYLIWMGYEYFAYLVMFSGSLMTITYLFSVFIIFSALSKPPQSK